MLHSVQIADGLLGVEALMARLVVAKNPDSVLAPIVQEHLNTGGKRLRARLALAIGLVLECPQHASLCWATACELAHNATLIHDDLQDGDTQRRGQPTAWVSHGMPQAINAGDLLLVLPYQAIANAALPASQAWLLTEALSDRLLTVIDGQATECHMTAQHVIDKVLYLQMIAKKTAALFELPVYGAALLKGYSQAQANALAMPFRALGTLFQMQDDVLDLYGEKGREAPGADLKEGKISFLVLEHMLHQPADTPWLLDLLKTPRSQTSDQAVNDAIQRFDQSGTVARVLTIIQSEVQAAKAAVDPLLAPILQELLVLILQPIEHLF